MLTINHALEGLDLSVPFLILSVIGIMLCMYIMQKSWRDDEANENPRLIRWLNRVAISMTALAISWGTLYAFQKQWQPWPPALALLTSFDFWLYVRCVYKVRDPGQQYVRTERVD